MSSHVANIVAKTFLELADALETGRMERRPVIALTGLGSEHGEQNAMAGAEAAQAAGVDVIYLGTATSKTVRCVAVSDEKQAHEEMQRLLSTHEADGAVTMHYPFPIGVSTVGRAITPARGKAMYLATTTGTSSTNRVEGMVRNAIYGMIAAKACGNPMPTVGIANIDGARQAETALKKLAEAGYPIAFAESQRADGGCIMRGNDILTGTPDIMVADPLTGNLIIKMLAAFSSGGSYESLGWGYGPGIGEGYEPLVMIVSRASGASVISGAIGYAGELIRGGYRQIAAAEFAAANAAGLKTVCAQKAEAPQAEKTVAPPPRQVVTGTISGVEVMDLDAAVSSLWAAGIYAESGMGCTGPIVLVPETQTEQCAALLKKAGFIGG